MYWLVKAVNQGHVVAQFNTGKLYHFGTGVPHNYNSAMEWYLKAEKQGLAAARCNIGLLYTNGQGVPQDYSKAMEWYWLSADQRGSGDQ